MNEAGGAGGVESEASELVEMVYEGRHLEG